MHSHRTPLTFLFLILVTLALPGQGFAQEAGRGKLGAANGGQQPGAQAQQPNQPAARSISLTQINSGVAPDGRGKLWAVVIGISNYKNLRPEEQFRFAHRDAEDLAAFLRSPNGGGFPSTQIKVLLNEESSTG